MVLSAIIHAIFAVAAELAVDLVKWYSSTKKDIGKTRAYDVNTATHDETHKMNEVLEKKRNEFINFCGELENNLQAAMDSIFNALIDSVHEISKDKGILISIESLQRDFDANSKKLRNNISGMVTRRIALSDHEFAEILKDEPGQGRSDLIEQYFTKIVREGFIKSEDEFSEVIDQAFSRVKDRINEKIQDKEESERQFLGELKKMRHELTKPDIKSREERFNQEKKKLNDFIRVLSQTAS